MRGVGRVGGLFGVGTVLVEQRGPVAWVAPLVDHAAADAVATQGPNDHIDPFRVEILLQGCEEVAGSGATDRPRVIFKPSAGATTAR